MRIAYIDVDPECKYLDDSPYKPFPSECREAFGEALYRKLQEMNGNIFLCMSSRVFFDLDICDGLLNQQKHIKYCHRKNTLFLANFPGVLEQVLWVLVSEPASIHKLGSAVPHMNRLIYG
jgi:hypothetical protein